MGIRFSYTMMAEYFSNFFFLYRYQWCRIDQSHWLLWIISIFVFFCFSISRYVKISLDNLTHHYHITESSLSYWTHLVGKAIGIEVVVVGCIQSGWTQSNAMALRLRKDVQKASYYVWFLGAEEARGLRGPRILLSAIPYLVERSRELEPIKVTLQVSHKGMKIIQVNFLFQKFIFIFSVLRRARRG